MTLVTGATGILGRVIVLELLKRGKTVRATKRKTSNLEEVRHSFKFYTENPDEFFNKIEWVDIDFDDIDSLKIAVNGVEEVYHCAAKVSFHPNARKKMYHSNIDGTKNLLYACENSSVKKFCFVSSIAVLDGFNEKGMMDEDSDFNSKLEHSAYAESKHFSEMEVWRASAEGLNVVIVNPGMIIGSGNWNESSGLIYENFTKGFTFSGGTSYVDVRDVAKISVELMEKNIFGERFILISENKRYSEMTNFVRNKLGKSTPKILSKLVLNFAKILNFYFGWFIPSLKMANKVNIESVTNLNTVSNQKIRERLDYQFIPIEESLDFHLKNYRQDKKL
ncbi:NAD-dependent epimerase/dehydratase family protein [Candidatus Kaistella beijingensis]|uniref:NAD-dependent epimerase/dehydratase family protein n=1 Tax=Candidatus Kaistella beijingensis TaxID=2820270 RepID=UPI001CC3B510|nr:NAD-dependent epimerase/dehydratase family protein [Candidatus Kaistella beijingensis]UBB90883.1 NAD-dependent epimerase/dehydratase family protein [Candidatus Kaistella beijingensis]